MGDARRGLLAAFRESKAARIAFKTVLVLAVTALCVVFFGLCVPFFLLSMEILPPLGVAGVIYVFAGGLFGLLFGGVSSIVSLARSEKLVTRYYAILLVTVAILSSAYYVAYMNVEALTRHL